MKYMFIYQKKFNKLNIIHLGLKINFCYFILYLCEFSINNRKAFCAPFQKLPP